ncbi:MAG: energy-coupling factor transporter ATPase [bacterium]
MISFKNVTYKYANDSIPAVKNLSFDIKCGELLCLMGANGSGKTTLARLIAGLIKPFRGRIDVGHNGNSKVGILFQNPDNQMVAVTVEKEIAFALENQNVPLKEMETRITRTLERFSITHLRKRLNSELSGGEKQRVALASVMIAEPSILLLDEPDSFLDQEGRVVLKAELKKLRESAPDMIQIHITQYPSTALNYDRLIIIHQGEIIADNAPKVIFDNEELCNFTKLIYNPSMTENIEFPEFYSQKTNNNNDYIKKIELKNICYSYHDEPVPIIKNLNLSILVGQVLGVAGCSGTGKSTLGLMLCGLINPTNGEIAYYNNNGEAVITDEIAGRVSAVLQQPERQFFLSTCSEEIEFGPANFSHPLSTVEVSSLLDMVGLKAEIFRNRDPFQLSGGEKRRLAFASILSMIPGIIVFDEPTCGLDQEGVGRFVALANFLKNMGIGIVIISHDGDLLRTLSDNILLMDKESRHSLMTTDKFFDDSKLAAIVSPLTWSTNYFK